MCPLAPSLYHTVFFSLPPWGSFSRYTSHLHRTVWEGRKMWEACERHWRKKEMKEERKIAAVPGCPSRFPCGSAGRGPAADHCCFPVMLCSSSSSTVQCAPAAVAYRAAHLSNFAKRVLRIWMVNFRRSVPLSCLSSECSASAAPFNSPHMRLN
jgi:hypothetical protein